MPLFGVEEDIGDISQKMLTWSSVTWNVLALWSVYPVGAQGGIFPYRAEGQLCRGRKTVSSTELWRILTGLRGAICGYDTRENDL